MFGNIRHDLRCGLRALRRNPALTVIATLAITLGTSLAITTFSIVNYTLLQPLPYAAPDRLVLVWESDLVRPQRLGMASDTAFDYWRAEGRSFESLGAVRNTTVSLTAVETPDSPLTRLVSASYFPLLGVEPLMGRTFSTEHEQPGAAKVVILSYSIWQRHYGGDPSILGRTVELDYEPYEVIGILPASYRSPIQSDPPQLWLPLVLNRAELDPRPKYLVYGRLSAGTTLEQARQELLGLAEDLRERYADTHTGRGNELQFLREILVAPMRPALLTLFGASVFVLLIACSNVANLLLARAMARFKEMALRTAIGAPPWLLVRQLVIENVLFALLGSTLGLVVAYWGIRALAILIPQSSVMPEIDKVAIDSTVILFALALAILLGLFFGLAPAYRLVLKNDPGSSLQADTVRSTTGRQRHVLRGSLVVAEVAISLILLIGAGLMIQTSFHRQRRDPGFDAKSVLTMRTSLRGSDYEEGTKRAAFFRQAIEKISVLPGVESVAAASRLPPSRPLGNVPFTLQGDTPNPQGSELQTLVRFTTPRFFETLSIPLLQGRFFADSDDDAGEPVVIVNKEFIQQYLGNQNPVGRLLTLKDGSDTSRKIIAVVGDVRTLENPPDPVPTVYIPNAQNPQYVMSFVIRTSVDPLALSQDVKRTVGRLDRLMPSYDIASLEETIRNADWQPRVSMILLSIFATIALFLAATGIYAVMSFIVVERTQEYGIRMALGANAGSILLTALRNGALLTAIGVVVGTIASLGLSDLLESQLYGVTKYDPTTFLGFIAFIVLIALTTVAVAAGKAIRLDPVTALRQG